VKKRSKNLAEPIHSFSFTVTEDDIPVRLDQFLCRKMSWRSRSFFQKMIRHGEVTVNNSPSRSGRYLLQDEKIYVDVSRYQQEFEHPESIQLDIIYEDDYILVLNKPAGIVVHPTGRHLYDTLMNAVHAHYENDAYLPRLVHRLDKDTSGVLVLAKSENIRTELARQIEGRQVIKTYRALTHGVFSRRDGEIIFPLNVSRYSHFRLKQDVVYDGGLPAHSIYHVEATAPNVTGFLNGLSLVNVRLITGRTHQIRVHLAAIGHPILADKLYGREKTCTLGETEIPRHLLHAWKFGCRHPATNEEIEFSANLPPVFAACTHTVFNIT